MRYIKFIAVVIAALFITGISTHAQNIEEKPESEILADKTESEIQSTDKKSFLRHEVHLSYGIFGTTDAADFAGGIVGSMLGQKIEDDGFYGNINVGYGYHFLKKLVGGVILSYSKTAFSLEDSDDARANNGKSIERHFSILPNVKYNWINKPHFALYSGLAAGMRLEVAKQKMGEHSGTITRARFAYQVSAIGVEGGWKHVHVFGELGWGQTGLWQVGIRGLF